MFVKEIMTKPPATCTTAETVADAARIMHEHKCGFVPVIDPHGAVVGVVTDRDVCMVVGDSRRVMTRVSVHDAMSRPVFSCYPDDDLAETLDTMAARQVRRLPVLDQYGHLQGVVSVEDIVLASSRRGAPTAEDIVAALRSISAPRTIEAS